MEALRRVFAKINAMMTDLTASQRLAIGLCAVVIAGSFLWLVRWSAEPEFVRLLNQPMNADELLAARDALPAGMSKIAGDFLLVPASQRDELFWKLQASGAMPADTSLSFEKLIEDASPFLPESENQFRRRVALQNELAKVLASSSSIRSAEVFIQDNSDRRIHSPNVVPTASVHVVPQAGETLDMEMVKACASIVAGAVRGLLVHNVSVVNGTTLREYKVANPEDSFAQGLLREQRRAEEHLESKILNQLAYIPGVHVSVSVELDSAQEQSRLFEYADPAISEETRTESSSSGGRSAGESGVGPNVGQALGGGTTQDNQTSEESSSKFQDQKLARETTRHKAPFTVQRSSASVAIPRSYLVNLARLESADQSEPTPEAVEQKYQAVAGDIRQIVKAVLMANRDEVVSVSSFADFDPGTRVLADGTLAAAEREAAPTSTVATFREYGAQGALGLMALIGLFMMWRMGKASASHTLRQHAASHATPTDDEEELLTVPSAPVGSAQAMEGVTLEGQEVDENTLRADHMVSQIRQLIEENSSDVSKLLRRWTDARD